MTLCYIALGGNRGDVPRTFAAALRLLDGPDIRVGPVSRLFATPPMGSDAGGTFQNAAASLETALDPLSLLDRLLSVEDQLGRRRDLRWGPRMIDLDLVFYGAEIIDHPRLRVPHAGCWYRRFVLDPLAEIAADVVHPETGETVGSLRTRLLERPFRVACDDAPLLEFLEASLQSRFPDILWTPDARQAAFTVSTSAMDDPATRTIRLPQDPEQTVDAAVATLVAALSDPEVIEACE